ncbi:ABC transporter permease [Candidatus Poribacteria bacterium]|nr:ABC transporter permease [Candidatus Poribacteria bacterium]
MKFSDAIATGMRHIQENRFRAGLSILGILIGIASVLCMMAIGDGAKQIIAEDIEKIGGANQIQFWTRQSVWRRGRRYPTTERYTLGDASAIEAECSEVTGVLPRNRRDRIFVTSSLGGEFRGADLEGVTADYAELLRYELKVGRFLSENDINNAAQVCVLGANVAVELFGKASAIGQEVKIRNHWRQTPVRMRVVGTMAPKGRNLSITWGSLDDMICVPITTYQQRITGIRYVERLIIFFQKDADAYDVVKSARKVIGKRHRGTHNFVYYWMPKRTVKQLERVEKMIKIALGGIAGFSLLVSGIGIMNICLVSVGEKTREIGLRKAVGAKRLHIFYQFLTESICLCLCGTLLGIAGGWLAAHGMARLAVRILPIVEKWPVVLSGQWILISVLFSVLMGISFGVYPAIRAARLSPIDALRAEN